jgi:hypothetical protein
MPYPQVIQFETLDLRRRRGLDTTDVPTRAAVRPARPGRRLPRRWRMRRTPQCASGAV